MHLPDKSNRLLLIILLAFSAFLFLQIINGVFSAIRGGDAVSYVLLAKSIATGHGFADINIPGAPPHTQYPPLLPLIMSPAFYLFGFNFTWMQLIVACFGLATAWMVTVYFEEEAGEGTAFVIALLTVTNFYFLFFVKEIMTEVPYAFLSLLALHLFRRYDRKVTISAGSVIALAAVVAAAYMMRMIGVTLYAGICAALFYAFLTGGEEKAKRIKKLIAFAALAIVPFVIWSVRGSLYSEGVATYQSIFMQADYYSKDTGSLAAWSLLARFAKNSIYYYEAVSKTILSASAFKGAIHGVMLKVLLFVFFIIFIVGYATECWRKRGAKEAYVFLYFGLLTVWPVYGTGDARRYIVPMLPFIYWYFLSGVRVLSNIRKAAPETARLRLKGFVLLLALFLLALNLFDIRRFLTPVAAQRFFSVAAALPARLLKSEPELTPRSLGNFDRTAPCYNNYLSASFQLKKVLAPEDVVLARKPEIVSLITGGYSVRFPYTHDGKAMLSFMERSGVSYVLLDGCFKEAGEYVVPVVLDNEERFTLLLKERDGTAILKFNSAWSVDAGGSDGKATGKDQ